MYKIEHHEESIVITISEADDLSDYRLINLLDYISYFTNVDLEENDFSVEDKEIRDLYYKLKEYWKVKKDASNNILRREILNEGYKLLNEVIIFKDCKAEVLPLTALLGALKGTFGDITSQTVIISSCKFDYVECSEDLWDFVITNSKIGMILNLTNRIVTTGLIESKISCYSSPFLFTENLNSETKCKVNFSNLTEIYSTGVSSLLDIDRCTLSIFRCDVPVLLAGSDLYRNYNVENTQNTVYLYGIVDCSSATRNGYLPKGYFSNELLPNIHANIMKGVHDYYREYIKSESPYKGYFDDY